VAKQRFARALIASLVIARVASAEVTPPRPIATHVPYPKDAAGDATVVIDLAIDESGNVQDASIIDGQEPFASRALEACRTFRFEPARRDDVAIRARVRLAIVFHPPPRPLLPDPTVEDVRVRGVRPDPVKTSIPAAEVRQLPGTFGDPFRSIEALPGITPIITGVPFFFVRGAPPGNTGYFLDGVKLPLLFHLALGPGVIHPALVDRVDFYPGGYPPRFGRFAGGIVAGETRPPASGVHGEANVRLFDVGALVETPLFGGRVTALAAGRYSYASALVQVFAPDTRVGYWDYQGRVSARITDKDTVSAFAFGSFDEILSRDRIGTVIPTGDPIKSDFYPVFRTEFHRLDVRHDHAFARGRVRTAITLGTDASATGTQQSTLGVGIKSISVRNEIESRVDKDVRIRGGVDATVSDASLYTRGNMAPASSLYPPRQEATVGAFGELVLRPFPRVEVSPGFRFDVYDAHAPTPAMPVRLGTLVGGAADVAIEPRVSARARVTEKLAYLATYGIAHQPPSFIVPVPGLSIGRLNHGLQTAVQTSQGVEIELPLALTLTVTGFLHAYRGLTDATTTCIDVGASSPLLSRDCLDARVRGRAFGLELMVRRPLTKRLSGWLSYTLSRSTRDTAGLVIPGRRPIGEGEILSDFDRTHVLGLVGAYDLGAGWRAGLRLEYYTGRPYTKRLGTEIGGIPIPPYNAARLPDFARIDVRVEKAWHILGGRLSLVIEWLNATLSPEAVGTDTCSLPPGQTFAPRTFDNVVCTFKSIGPVSVPSIGVEGEL
jgi:TonB family protein